MAHSTSSTTHRLLRSLLASCWLFSPLLVADATTPQHSARGARPGDDFGLAYSPDLARNLDLRDREGVAIAAVVQGADHARHRLGWLRKIEPPARAGSVRPAPDLARTRALRRLRCQDAR